MTGDQSQIWLFFLGWDLRQPGGVSQVVANLYDEMTAQGKIRPLLLVDSWKQNSPLYCEEDGRRIVYFRIRSPWDSRQVWRNLLSYVSTAVVALARLRRIIIRNGVRTVNMHYPGLEGISWLVLRFLMAEKFRIVLSFHGSDLRDASRTSGIEHWLWRQLTSRSDAIIVCSDDLKESLVNEFGVSPQAIEVVDNGVDISRIQRLSCVPASVESPSDFIISLGTLEHKKGHDVLIRAFADIADEYPKLDLVIAGRMSDTHTYVSLCGIRSELSCGSRIHIFPDLPHAEAMNLLARARFLVLASRVEPFGIVVLEAGALLRPVVATDVCGAVRRLRVGSELLTVPADDVMALAVTMRQMLESPIRMTQLAEALNRRVADLTWSTALRGYLRAAGELQSH